MPHFYEATCTYKSVINGTSNRGDIDIWQRCKNDGNRGWLKQSSTNWVGV